eukprot:1188591-Prorocentrum_minimum.AAC.1
MGMALCITPGSDSSRWWPSAFHRPPSTNSPSTYTPSCGPASISSARSSLSTLKPKLSVSMGMAYLRAYVCKRKKNASKLSAPTQRPQTRQTEGANRPSEGANRPSEGANRPSEAADRPSFRRGTPEEEAPHRT